MDIIIVKGDPSNRCRNITIFIIFTSPGELIKVGKSY